ncbi:hypothetical protein TIFTF001_024381 [Ficus carica]|uniref:Uncharacterized protein n=1 Tax=Ficus carica TaxID=3494 RepID=A0AA88DD94_FICCA|nr:hypothetical protein TIFTF001_024381 [Ficus carica]
MGRRVSGRHSSAGERRRALFQMVDTASFRRSLDSWSWRRKRDNHNQNQSKSSVAVGCFDRKERKDGLLLTHDQRRRLEHRIIVSPPGCGDGDGGGIQCYNDERWSDVQPSDLLYLRSEMIMSDSRRFSSSAGAAAASSGSAWAKSVGSRNDKDRKRQDVEEEEGEERSRVHNLHSSSSSTIDGIDDHDYDGISGRRVINTRSVSEITGLTRLSSNDNNSRRATNDTNQQRRQQGLIRRWLSWVSQLKPPQQEMV